MKTEEFENPNILEYETWQNLIKTPEWIYFLNILKSHKEYLDRQTCIEVNVAKFNDAMRLQAKSEDITKIINLVEKRLNELGRMVKQNG